MSYKAKEFCEDQLLKRAVKHLRNNVDLEKDLRRIEAEHEWRKNHIEKFFDEISAAKAEKQKQELEQ